MTKTQAPKRNLTPAERTDREIARRRAEQREEERKSEALSWRRESPDGC